MQSFNREHAFKDATPVWPEWAPFRIDTKLLLAPRGLISPSSAPKSMPLTEVLAGVGDRLRAAAFAEVQAEAAFLWAAEKFAGSAPAGLTQSWRELAIEERKHRDWLLARLEEIGIDLRDRPVSDALWNSFMRCETARDFCKYMAGAEERGRRAGERFGLAMIDVDRHSGAIFTQIALEEVRHIELAYEFYPELRMEFKKENRPAAGPVPI